MSCFVSCRSGGTKPVFWHSSSDEDIVQALEDAYAGNIDLVEDYGWYVGQERTVHLSAMPATGVGESHVEQDVTFVLMNRGGYTLVDGKTCQFVVGLKNCLLEEGYMNSTNTNVGSWSSSARRTWCNSVFYNAVPSTLRPIFKQFNCLTAQTYNGTTNQITQDYFALPAAAEVFKGDSTYGTGGTAGTQTANSNLTEFNALSRWTWYETRVNRIKTLGDYGSMGRWWERSPLYNSSNHFCYVNTDGSTNYNGASAKLVLAPFGCI